MRFPSGRAPARLHKDVGAGLPAHVRARFSVFPARGVAQCPPEHFRCAHARQPFQEDFVYNNVISNLRPIRKRARLLNYRATALRRRRASAPGPPFLLARRWRFTERFVLKPAAGPKRSRLRGRGAKRERRCGSGPRSGESAPPCRKKARRAYRMSGSPRMASFARRRSSFPNSRSMSGNKKPAATKREGPSSRHAVREGPRFRRRWDFRALARKARLRKK